MNKQDYLWCGIRIFGVYLLVLAIIELPQFIISIYVFYDIDTFPGGSGSPSFGYEDALNASRIAIVSGAMKTFASFVIYVLSALYFLRYGKLIFRMIDRV